MECEDIWRRCRQCRARHYGINSREWYLGEIDFRDHLEVEPFEFQEEGITRVRFKKGENDCIYQVFFQYLDDMMITYAFAS